MNPYILVISGARVKIHVPSMDYELWSTRIILRNPSDNAFGGTFWVRDGRLVFTEPFKRTHKVEQETRFLLAHMPRFCIRIKCCQDDPSCYHLWIHPPLHFIPLVDSTSLRVDTSSVKH